MDDIDSTQAFDYSLPMDEPIPSAPVRHARRRTAAIAGTALLIGTAMGAAGGVAWGDVLHHSSANSSTAVLGPQGARTVPTQPGYGGNYPQTFGGYGGQFAIPGQSTTSQVTSPATAAQLVGLVRIQATQEYQGGIAVGTGMILTSNGQVVTNHHVIEGSTKIVVTVMSTGTQYQATLVGSDETDDIAVLQLDGASGLSTIQPNTSPVSIGQSVTAVGDAQGASTFTASSGKVTAVDQTISPSDGAETETLSGVIQYAANVMSGDSGGATYDSSGKVVAMTTAASSGQQTNGYAIPIAKVLEVASQLASHTSNSKYSYGLPAFIGVGVDENAVVQQVYANTGAAASGLTPGDRIVAVNGKAVSTADQLQAAVRAYASGDSVTLTWTTSSGTRASASVKLASGPAV